MRQGKLSNAVVRKIFLSTKKTADLATEYGLSPGYIYLIRQGNRYADVTAGLQRPVVKGAVAKRTVAKVPAAKGHAAKGSRMNGASRTGHVSAVSPGPVLSVADIGHLADAIVDRFLSRFAGATGVRKVSAGRAVSKRRSAPAGKVVSKPRRTGGRHKANKANKANKASNPSSEKPSSDAS